MFHLSCALQRWIGTVHRVFSQLLRTSCTQITSLLMAHCFVLRLRDAMSAIPVVLSAVEKLCSGIPAYTSLRLGLGHLREICPGPHPAAFIQAFGRVGCYIGIALMERLLPCIGSELWTCCEVPQSFWQFGKQDAFLLLWRPLVEQAPRRCWAFCALWSWPPCPFGRGVMLLAAAVFGLWQLQPETRVGSSAAQTGSCLCLPLPKQQAG